LDGFLVAYILVRLVWDIGPETAFFQEFIMDNIEPQQKG
jgi:hypothetical protein